MKPVQSSTTTKTTPKVSRPNRPWYTSPWLVGAALLTLACLAYAAVLRAPFLFDDFGLPYANPLAWQTPFIEWVRGVRPVLLVTYWLNYRPPPTPTFPFHLTNVVMHAMNAMLVFLVAQHLFRRSVPDAAKTFVLSCFCSALFLLHPLQTESVAYIAGRSEVLSATFVLLAWWIYVRRLGTAVTFRQSALLLLLFALAATTKEQAVATLPAIFLVTDWFFGEKRFWSEVRANFRLYVPLGLGAMAASAWVATVLLTSKSAGPNAGVSPLSYLFTQFRAILLYVRLFVFPVGQNADREFPISNTLLDHGSALALCALIGLTVLLLTRAPLVRYSWILFLAFLAPTSSVVPLADAFAERRTYLPVAALCLLVGALLTRFSLSFRTVAACTTGIGIVFLATLSRAEVWSSSTAFWKDVAEKSPHKARAYQHLTHAYVSSGQCEAAIEHLEKAKTVMPKDYYILINWAQAYRCADRTEAALQKLQEAERLVATATVYGLMAETLLKLGRISEAQQAFAKAAEREPPGSELWHVYKGNLALLANNPVAAQEELQKAMVVNPFSPEAGSLMRRLQAATVSPTQQRSRTGSPAQPGAWPLRLPGQFKDKRMP